MLDSPRLFHLLKFAVPIAVLVWCAAYLGSATSSNAVLRKFKDEKEVFVADFLSHEIDGNFDGSGLAGLCSRAKFTPGLVLTCDPPPGGVGSVKNGHLNCIRFAIEMGAELVLPRIIKRSSEDITIIVPDAKAPVKGEFLDYFFDYEHLNRTLSKFCPQMTVHQSMDDLWDVPSLLNAHPIGLGEMQVAMRNGTVIDDIKALPEQIRKFVEEKSPAESRRLPVRFNLIGTFFAWPTAGDDPVLAKNFGRILRFREETRQLAASALFNLQKRFRINLDPRNGIKSDTFVGVHLRTEADADNLFPPYETQAAYYLDYVTSSKSPLVYLATGASQDNITAFSTRAKDFNLTVVLKSDILEGEDLERLDKLTWDQRALVDYEIMLRAGLVTGPSESSFAWNLALRRANIYRSLDTADEAPSSESIQWQDKYSTIFGNSERGIAMRQTIWP